MTVSTYFCTKTFNVAGVGSLDWVDLINGGANDDAWITATNPTPGTPIPFDNVVRLGTYNGVALNFYGASNPLLSNTWQLNVDRDDTFGAATNFETVWNLSSGEIGPTEINDTLFSAILSTTIGVQTKYLVAGSFNAAIPLTDTIQGLQITYQRHYEVTTRPMLYVDSIKLVVTHEAPPPPGGDELMLLGLI